MRACTAANTFFGVATLTAAAFAACTGGSPPPQQPSGEAASTAAPGSPASADTPPSGEAPATGGGTAPQSVADCKAKLSEVTNEPPSGVVTNNAMTAADAGSSDRFEPLLDLVKSKREAFRCCFDLYAKKNPGAHGRVQMVFQLKPDGSLIKAEVDEAASGIHSPDVSSCMIDVARSISYPKSPSGKETKFTYPFDFKARN
jgi:hypothetical protein